MRREVGGPLRIPTHICMSAGMPARRSLFEHFFSASIARTVFPAKAEVFLIFGPITDELDQSHSSEDQA